jgi:hypothetical protein
MRYLHCTKEIEEIKAHAQAVGKIELIGRNDRELNAGKNIKAEDFGDCDWDWQDWGKGDVYALRDIGGHPARAYGDVCFLLEGNGALDLFSSRSFSFFPDGYVESLVPAGNKIVEVIEIEGENEVHFSPEEWINK